MQRILAVRTSRTRTSESAMTKDDIWRTAEHEVFRRNTEGTDGCAWTDMTTIHQSGGVCASASPRETVVKFKLCGGDALRGHTRSHPEHDG